MEALPLQRPGSLRSVASNSSLGSAVSLSRRPRTRARSRTVTGSPKPGDVPPSPIPSDLPYLGGTIVQEPLEPHDASTSAALSTPPLRPPRSPQRVDGLQAVRSSDTGSSQGTSAPDQTFADPTQSTAISSKQSKAAKQATSLPHLDTGYRPPPSAFSRDPAMTPVANVRDSVSTQQSGASSSLYPPSTSTASALESPTYPQSMATDQEIPPFALEVNEVQEYDSDDVSYRLRLLVKNNYFLPPAHSKPSAADFAPPIDPQKRSPRTGTPGFLDIFRVGKSKSKPTTPTGTGPGVNSLAPMLRTTSDSIAAPYTTRQQQPRPSGQLVHAPPPSPAPPSRGRVVVVREKMQDIAVAAKQAEQDLKTRGVRIDQGSQKTAPAADDDFIDPTDAVDLPLPSPLYPFPVQASALHGLGVLESLGADVLADHLPPSENPNLSMSYDPIEDSWRKAILKQAVHHSLDNTPETSTFSHAVTSASPVTPRSRSKTVDSPRMPSPNVAQKLLINQKILAPSALDDAVKAATTKHARQKSAHSQASAKGKAKLLVPTPDTSLDSRPASYQRVETPLGPMTPLGPPPRRPFLNMVHSSSQVELAHSSSSNDLPANDSRRTVRRAVSSPSLAEGYDSHTSRHCPITPPPLPGYPRDSQATFTSFGTVRGNYDSDDMSMELMESENEGGRAPSLRSVRSAVISRPSLSEYSQASQSPTTSVFQDMLNRNRDNHSSSASAGPSRFSIEDRRAMIGNPASRALAMSPPPRQSSSLAHAALSPPPRSSSFHYQASGIGTSNLSHSESRPYHIPQPDSEESRFEILAPEPSSPPLPSAGLQDEPMHSSLYPSMDMQLGMRSNPGPSSPTSFFDSIQSQPNAMDDLESSSDESDTEELHPLPPIQPANVFAEPRSRAISSVSESGPRPPIMKLGNFSTPHVRDGERLRQHTLPIGHSIPKQSIGNNPMRPTKNDIIASSDFFKYAQANPPTSSMFSTQPTGSKDVRRPSTADQEVTSWRNNQRAQESLRKLDGMLLQHMEDEKDTIKRIATTLKQTKLPSSNTTDSQSSSHPDRR